MKSAMGFAGLDYNVLIIILALKYEESA